jgi:hypothetical protein
MERTRKLPEKSTFTPSSTRLTWVIQQMCAASANPVAGVTAIAIIRTPAIRFMNFIGRVNG